MRLTLQRTLGVLWIFDGLLQLQPLMFTMDMETNVMRPLLSHQPQWLLAVLLWAVRLFSSHLLAGNLLVAGVQIAIGLSLFFQWAPRVGLVASIIWGLGIWMLGEGLGGLLAGEASAFTGAPGSVLLYVLWAGFALSPASRSLETAHRPIEWALAGFWLLGGVLQAMPQWWHGAMLYQQIDSNLTATTVAQPLWAQGPILWSLRIVQHYPLGANAALVIVFFALGLAWALRMRGRPILVALTLLWIIAIWWVGEGFGMLLVGMSTDPNTGPLIAMAVLAVARPPADYAGDKKLVGLV